MSTPIYVGDIYLVEDGDTIRFGNTVIELCFSLSTGYWTSIVDPATRTMLSTVDSATPPFVFNVGGYRKGEGVVRNSRVFDLDGANEVGWNTNLSNYSAVQHDQGTTLEVTCSEEDWLITSIYQLNSGDGTILRSLRLKYCGVEEVLLQNLRFLTPPIRFDDTQRTWVEAPGYPVVPHFPAEEIPEGIWQGLDSRTLTEPGLVQHSVDAPGSVTGLVSTYWPDQEMGILFWPYSIHEFSVMELEKKGSGLAFSQWLFLADRFPKGHTIETGCQYIRLAHGNWDAIMLNWQSWFDSVGLSTPQDRPNWAIGAAFYEVHVGRAPFLGGLDYEPYPDMSDLTNDLPRIKAMGFEVIQLMPHWPFCGYTVHQYEDIDNQYGDVNELKVMVNAAHHLGLKVILDIVLHGVIDKEIARWNMEQFGPRYDFIFGKWLDLADERAKYRDGHPEWFMQDENEQIARIYTWAFDHGNPSFQDFIINILKFYLDELSVDGFRFDAPTWNCMPNWKRGLPTRASAAYYAAYQLMTRVRRSIKTSHPQALLYTEPSGPLFRHTMDLTYNYDEEWLTGSILKPTSERGYAGAKTYTGKGLTAAEIADWMHYQRYSLPTGSMTVHHLDSHDTFWWGELAQFRYEAFGSEATRAMFAFFALVGGGIMNYVGSEHGSESFYRTILELRKRYPELRYGNCDFRAVKASHPMILPLLRSHQGKHLIPIIHFGTEEISANLSIPGDMMGLTGVKEFLVFDLLNLTSAVHTNVKRYASSQLLDLPITILPYGVQILELIPLTG